MRARISLREAAEFLRTHDHYLILSHRRPDGDTVGSCAALCRVLRALGKEAWVYDNPQFTPKFAPYLDGLTIRQDQLSIVNCQFSIVSCDVASRGLFPFGMEQAQVALAIDHHGSNEDFAVRSCVDGSRAACGEILLELLPLLGVALDKPMAEALYVAISTDTGCFRYANVTPNTFRCAALCAAAGAELYPINRAFFEIKRRPRLQLEAHLIETMEFFAGGRVAVSAISEDLIQELGLTEDDIDDIAGFGRSVEGVDIAVMLREVEQGMGKCSVRTSPAFDAARICRRLGGGGHPGAAGASLPGGLPAIRAAVLASIGEELEL
ncbi:MAG: DHH family phosphoesterase [Oscillospiraceae bacterium]|nr:DHH family phosphoesterase [Oscillospiraceae bacterium]